MEQNTTPLADAKLRGRFEAKVSRAESGCWEWIGSICKATGYGQLNVKRADGRWIPDAAHRISFRLFVGDIPKDLVIDHLCRNRTCVNPEHLEPVTPRTNFLRGVHPSAMAVRTNRCVYGHEFTGENTIVGRAGSRDCRACRKRRNDSRPRNSAATLRERFDVKYRVDPDGCWQWTAASLATGYGAMRVDGRTVTAHRVAYELFVGAIPPATSIRHACGNRQCVNPAHLQTKGATEGR